MRLLRVGAGLVVLFLTLWSQSSASVAVTLQLDDDTVALAKFACAQSTGAVCTNPEASAYASTTVNQKVVAEWRGQYVLFINNAKVATWCALFAAASAAQKNVACTGLGLPAGCTPPGC